MNLTKICLLCKKDYKCKNLSTYNVRKYCSRICANEAQKGMKKNYLPFRLDRRFDYVLDRLEELANGVKLW